MLNPKANAAAAEIILDTLAQQHDRIAWLIQVYGSMRDIETQDIRKAVTAIMANLELDRRRSAQAVMHGGE